MKKGLLILILSLSSSFLFAQKTDKNLTLKIQLLLQGFHGDAGIFVKDLKTNKIVAIHADTLFPTASIVKIPILIGIMDKLTKGELQYHQDMQYKDSLFYSGSDILGSFKNNESIPLAKLIMLMLTTSDNTASLWLQSIAGTGTRINAILDSTGYKFTRVNSRTPGREADRAQYGWGQTTPREMASLLEEIFRGKMINDSASAKMIRLLGRNYWDEQAISQIPPTIFVASKNGAVDASRSEVLLVMAKRPYIFSIFTKKNTDKSWGNDNEAWMLAKKLSALLFDHFNR